MTQQILPSLLLGASGSPLHHSTGKENKLKIASGCIWAAVGWETGISILLMHLIADGNLAQLIKWTLDEDLLCFDDMIVPFRRRFESCKGSGTRRGCG